MGSPKTALRDSDWLKHHLQINDRTAVDPPQDPWPTKVKLGSRDETPGRSRSKPIIVSGEEAPPLIVVESRDISPDPRITESHVHHGSPRSESHDKYMKHGKDQSRGKHIGSRSRTLSPQPRSRQSHKTSKSDENIDFAYDSIKSKHVSSHSLKIETKESTACSDAVTSPHANRKGGAKYTKPPTLISNRSTSGNLSPTSIRTEDDDIPNITSMTSSLTSIDSNDDRFEEKQYLPGMLIQQAAATKQRNSSLKTKNILPQPGERIGRYSQRNNFQFGEKAESVHFQHSSHQKGKRDTKSDVSIVGEYPSTPMSTTETTPDIIYDALNDGNTAYTPIGNGNGTSPLSYNLSGVLRGSSSDTASFFHDFHNPNIALSPKKPPLRISTEVETPKSELNDSPNSKSPIGYHPVSTPLEEKRKRTGNQHRPTRSLVDNDQDEVVSAYSTNNDISRHSILQLCTEDLMSDDSTRVNAALVRLHEVCCLVSKTTDDNMKTTSSVASTSSTSSSVLNRIRFIKAGGHALIVGVMKKYANDATIQASACKLIQQLIMMDECNVQSSSNSTNGSSAPNRNGNSGAFNELFSAVYGMDCVISALQRYRPQKSMLGNSDGDVYNLACGALVAIVCSSFKMVDRLLQHDTRYISIFLKAIHAPINKNCTGVNRVIYYVLKQFPQNVNEIVMAGGIEEVINEMKHFPDSMEVQYCGCAVIGTLLKKNSRMMMSTLSAKAEKKDGDRSMVEYVVNHLEGASLIVAALKSFPYNEDIQGKGVIALCNITTSAAATKANVVITSTIKKAGGLSAIGIALENFTNNQTVQDHGCLAIKSLLESAVAAPRSE